MWSNAGSFFLFLIFWVDFLFFIPFDWFWTSLSNIFIGFKLSVQPYNILFVNIVLWPEIKTCHRVNLRKTKSKLYDRLTVDLPYCSYSYFNAFSGLFLTFLNVYVNGNVWPKENVKPFKTWLGKGVQSVHQSAKRDIVELNGLARLLTILILDPLGTHP